MTETHPQEDREDEAEEQRQAALQNVRDMVMKQTTKQDLSLIDMLFGRYALPYIATPEEIKEEALRQVKLDWAITLHTDADEDAEHEARIARAMRCW